MSGQLIVLILFGHQFEIRKFAEVLFSRLWPLILAWHIFCIVKKLRYILVLDSLSRSFFFFCWYKRQSQSQLQLHYNKLSKKLIVVHCELTAVTRPRIRTMYINKKMNKNLKSTLHHSMTDQDPLQLESWGIMTDNQIWFVIGLRICLRFAMQRHLRIRVILLMNYIVEIRIGKLEYIYRVISVHNMTSNRQGV